MALRTTLVGLGTVGSSIGLALKHAGAKLEIVGHDKDHQAARGAHKAGCVDRTEWNLISACDGSDLIVISTPLAEVKSTLAAIAQDLKPGCVVTDTVSLKVPVLSWASDLLPSTVHFVGGHPILSGTFAGSLAPAADLFSGAVYCLTPGAAAPPQAVQRVSDLAEAMGASPYYLDAAEHDGLMAAVEQLPLLIAVGLQAVAGDSPSYREMTQLSGADFESVTQLLRGDAAELTELCALNRSSIVRWLDVLLPKLTTLRDAIAGADNEPLRQSFARALEVHAGWRRKPAEAGATDYSDFGMARMMLGDTFRPRKPKGD